ncbi:MAG: hypothetical protein GY941_13745 [Planctomycetes bacterium]|nr:hypothetical protein [Planctomycetota bacterium]
MQTKAKSYKGRAEKKSSKKVSGARPDTIEYVNITDRMRHHQGRIHPESMFFHLSDGSTKLVQPGESFFLTKKDIDRYIAEGNKNFVEEKVRPLSDLNSCFESIDINDDMPVSEINTFVKSLINSTELKIALDQLTSDQAIKRFKKSVEKFDKPISFFRECENRHKGLKKRKN